MEENVFVSSQIFSSIEMNNKSTSQYNFFKLMFCFWHARIPACVTNKSVSLYPDPRGCVVCNPCQCCRKWVSTPVERGREVTPADSHAGAGDETTLLTQREVKLTVRHPEKTKIYLSYTIHVSDYSKKESVVRFAQGRLLHILILFT